MSRVTWARIALVFTVLLGVGSGLVATSTPAKAIEGPFIECFVSQCMNNWNGALAQGNPVKFYADPAGRNNDQWQLTNLGAVVGCCDGSVGPFTDGSGLNAQYAGQPVYRFDWIKNGVVQDASIDAMGYNPFNNNGGLEIQPTDLGSDWHTVLSTQMFVYSKSGFWVSVSASNFRYKLFGTNGIPVWLGGNNGGYANGKQVSIANANANSWQSIAV